MICKNDTLTITASDATLKNAVVIKAEYNNNIMSNVKTYPVSFTNKQALIEGIEIAANEVLMNYINDKVEALDRERKGL